MEVKSRRTSVLQTIMALQTSNRSGTAERNFVWGGYSPFLKSLLCVKLKSTIYSKIIGGAIAPLAPLLRGPCRLSNTTRHVVYSLELIQYSYNVPTSQSSYHSGLKR